MYPREEDFKAGQFTFLHCRPVFTAVKGGLMEIVALQRELAKARLVVLLLLYHLTALLRELISTTSLHSISYYSISFQYNTV